MADKSVFLSLPLMTEYILPSFLWGGTVCNKYWGG